MPHVSLEHFEIAANDIASNGDNDTLPFDIDVRFIKEKSKELSSVAHNFYMELEKAGKKETAKRLNGLQIFHERLLVPTGSAGFRVTTKIHPFWNLYLNGLAVAVAEQLEPIRSNFTHSYRFKPNDKGIFDKDKSWRAYRQATLDDPSLNAEGVVVVQTDISNFYEHVYHHRLENCINDLFPDGATIGTQIDRILCSLASGRSFGLPVGGQAARILAEVMLNPIDTIMNDQNISAHRYVDDFTLITNSNEEAYKALSALSYALADYGLALNRTKTTTLSGKHYSDFVETQLGGDDNEARLLTEIDLHFDPYSDAADDNYGELRETVKEIDVKALLELELAKSTPDTFLVAQISRTLKFQSPLIAVQLCETILHSKNLNAFRASWSTIMRGLAAVRSEADNAEIFEKLDELLDLIPTHSSHLLQPEANLLHYLRTLRFVRTESRARFVRETFDQTKSETDKRGCIECWMMWKDRPSFNMLRNIWQNMSVQQQRYFWLAAAEFGDEGNHFKKQTQRSLSQSWGLGIEAKDLPTFQSLYESWAKNGI